MKFNNDLVAVHAYLCGDGYVIRNPKTQKKKYYRIGFRNTNEILLNDFQKRFEMFFGKRPKIDIGERCRVDSKEIYEKLTKEFGSFYSWHWKMLKLNKELSKTWLRAFFDCEGWVICKSHQSRMIGLDSVNLEGLSQVKLALEKLSIMCKIRFRKEKNIYVLSIYGRENLGAFREKIGFLHPNKKEKLEKVMDDYVNYNWNFPLEENKLKKFIRNIMLTKAKAKKNRWAIRLVSNRERNLVEIQKGLNKFFNVKSSIYKMKNGIGTIYYGLNISKIEEIKKVVNNSLLSNEEKQKWLKLKK